MFVEGMTFLRGDPANQHVHEAAPDADDLAGPDDPGRARRLDWPARRPVGGQLPSVAEAPALESLLEVAGCGAPAVLL